MREFFISRRDQRTCRSSKEEMSELDGGLAAKAVGGLYRQSPVTLPYMSIFPVNNPALNDFQHSKRNKENNVLNA